MQISGTLVDNTLMSIEGATRTVDVMAVTSLNLEDVNVHKLTLVGYYAGISDSVPSIVPVSYTDNGEDTNIGVDFPFNDDFSWLEPYIEIANASLDSSKQISDSVGDQLSSADGAANIYTLAALVSADLVGALRDRGYTDLNPGFKTI